MTFNPENVYTDPGIDAYRNLPVLPRPIFIHLRKLVHKACPGCGETIKWKRHLKRIVFWVLENSIDPDPQRHPLIREATGSLGRITSIKDLPPGKVIMDFIKAAKKLNDDGVKLPAAKKTRRRNHPQCLVT